MVKKDMEKMLSSLKFFSLNYKLKMTVYIISDIGDCSCQPGVTGKHCSSCLPQYWDFTADGCKSCECELDGAVGCDV